MEQAQVARVAAAIMSVDAETAARAEDEEATSSEGEKAATAKVAKEAKAAVAMPTHTSPPALSQAATTPPHPKQLAKARVAEVFNMLKAGGMEPNEAFIEAMRTVQREQAEDVDP